MGEHEKQEHLILVLSAPPFSLPCVSSGKVFSVLFVHVIDFFLLLLFSASLEQAPQPYGIAWYSVTGC